MLRSASTPTASQRLKRNGLREAGWARCALVLLRHREVEHTIEKPDEVGSNAGGTAPSTRMVENMRLLTLAAKPGSKHRCTYHGHLLAEGAMAANTQRSSDSADAVERSVLSEQVKDRLLQQIVEGELSPGSRIVETKVAREFGTSQAPVREALRALASLGLVEVRPHRGAWVRQPTRHELAEAAEVRGALEAFAAEQAAKSITDQYIRTLEGLLEEMIALATVGDAHEQAVKNAEFHATIINAAGNATLERTWKLLEPFSQTYLTASVPGVDLMWLAERHNELLDALRDRDPSRASDAARKHLHEAAEIKEASNWGIQEEAAEEGGD